MRLGDTLQLSFDSLRRNQGRAVLTMLGIIIGVASVILMMAIGNGAERFILSQVASFGSDMVFVRNGSGDGKQGAGPPTTAVKQVLTLKDYDRLKHQSWVRTADAEVMSQLLIESPSNSYHEQVSGSSEAGLAIFNAELASGSFFTVDDVDSRAKVAVLGHDLAADLFGQEDPLGKIIKIGKKSYHVIGTLKPAGTRFFTNLDRGLYVPVTALMEQLNVDRLQFMAIKIGDTPPAQAKEQIRVLLRETHKLDNPTGDLSKDDFFVATQEDAAQRAGTIGTILEVLLSSIAAISLVVGGVGIMNIMYVAVTERTREIGLRKAIGAQRRDVLAQFLAEAVVLTILAGLGGVVLGVIFAWGALTALGNYQSGWTFVMPWNAMAMGFGVSAAIGIAFGYLPARSAAQLNPIEALRYE